MRVRSRDGLPLERRWLVAEEREPRADAAGGVIEDAVLAAAHARRGMVPEALLGLALELELGWGLGGVGGRASPNPPGKRSPGLTLNAHLSYLRLELTLTPTTRARTLTNPCAALTVPRSAC